MLDWLESGGLDCQINCVQTRTHFTEALYEGEFEVILADYSLPGFDGLTALQLAQEIRPEVPFIFVSGYLGEDLAIETLKRGATDYVLKGRLERLVPSVERAIRESKEREVRRRIESTLHILSEASLVLSSLDYSTTLTQVARLAIPHFADYCAVDVVAEDGNIERVAVAHKDISQSVSPQSNFSQLKYSPVENEIHPILQVLESKQSQLLSDVPAALLETNAHMNEPPLAEFNQLKLQSCMIIPLIVEGEALGVMTLISSSSRRRYDSLDLSLAEDLARRCAMAIENARLHQKTVDALRSRDEFLAVLSHELRSPLTSILGWVQLLQDGDLDEEMQKRAFEVIERNTQSQVQLIQDLLEVSRIITGRLSLKMAPVSIPKLIKNVVDLIIPTASAKGVEVRFLDGNTDCQVLGDEPRLQQVLWNLVSNAVKFTPKGGKVTLNLTIDNEFIKILIHDTGEGISPSFLPYVFDRFRQANSSSTRQHGGLGLGLSIVRHISEMHGGFVRAQSDGIGLGSTFTVNLPIISKDYGKCEAIEENSTPTEDTVKDISDSSQQSLDGVKILLVEDGQDARELISAVLKRAGAEVTDVSCVADAINEIYKVDFDILITDIGMPIEDGYSLIQRVREWEIENNRQLPAIALTAYVSEQDRIQALKSGFQIHLAKPVEPNLLLLSVAKVLGHS
jgi:signal transduction histidine kinase/DNA-binding response OmpR family regulator